MQILNLTRSESTGPMRFFQLAPETSLAGGGRRACKEAIPFRNGGIKASGLADTRDLLSPAFRTACLSALDDILTMRQKQAQQLDVYRKRHLTERLLRHDVPRR